jgi:hypothetical protein
MIVKPIAATIEIATMAPIALLRRRIASICVPMTIAGAWTYGAIGADPYAE